MIASAQVRAGNAGVFSPLLFHESNIIGPIIINHKPPAKAISVYHDLRNGDKEKISKRKKETSERETELLRIVVEPRREQTVTLKSTYGSSKFKAASFKSERPTA